MGGLLRVILEVVLFTALVYGTAKIFAGVMTAAFPGLAASARKSGSARRTRTVLNSPASLAVRRAGRSAAAAAVHPTRWQIRGQAKADVRRAWAQVKATDWLEGRRHERQLTASGATITPATITGTTGTGQDGSIPAPPPAAVNGTKGPAPPPQAMTPPAPASTNGGTTVAAGTSTASAEKLIEGINEIYAKAASGGIHAKQEAVKAAHEACVRFAAMSQMLARTMAEPDHNYGPEITEPCSKAGQHLQAAAMAYSEADAAISTLINMTVGDLAASPRQAPHHRELSESGAH